MLLDPLRRRFPIKPNSPHQSRFIPRDTGPLPRQRLTTERKGSENLIKSGATAVDQFHLGPVPRSPLVLERQPTEGSFSLLLVRWGTRKGQRDIEIGIRSFPESSYKHKSPTHDDVSFVVNRLLNTCGTSMPSTLTHKSPTPCGVRLF